MNRQENCARMEKILSLPLRECFEKISGLRYFETWHTWFPEFLRLVAAHKKEEIVYMVTDMDDACFLPQLGVETDDAISNPQAFYTYLRDECLPTAMKELGVVLTQELFTGFFAFMPSHLQEEAFEHIPMLKEWQEEYSK